MRNREPAVLLVEDEPLLSELMTEALTDHGFEVHTQTIPRTITAKNRLIFASPGSPSG